MLRHAMKQPSIESVRSQPYLARYAIDWGRTGDFGCVAYSDDLPIGAAWLRLWVGADRGFGYISDDIPELGFAVLPDYRGMGIGTQLLKHVLQVSRERVPAVSLSVQSDNFIIGLYERSGFVKVADSEDPNCADSGSFTMVCKFE